MDINNKLYVQLIEEYYKKYDIYQLWKEHSIVREHIDKCIEEEDIKDIYDLRIESEVIYKLIRQKPLDDKFWLLNQLRDAQRYYEKNNDKEKVEFLAKQIDFFERYYF